MTCKVVFGNVGRGLAAMDGLLEYAREKKADVLCVCEPATVQDKPRRHPAWVCVAKNGPRCKTAVYVDKQVTGWEVEGKPRSHSVAVRLKGVVVSATYWHPAHGKEAKAKAWCEALEPNDRRVLVGDFNAVHPAWNNNPRQSSRGKALLEVTDGLGLALLNRDKKPTHRRGNTLDLAFGPPEAHARVGYWVSDHRALEVQVGRAPQTRAKQEWVLPWEEVGAARADVANGLGEAPGTAMTTGQLDQQAWHIHNVLRGVVQTRGQLKPARAKAKWWTRELKKARDDDPDSFKRECRKARREYYQGKIAKAGPNELGPLYKWKNPSPDDRPSELKVAGRRVTSQTGIAKAMAESAFPRPSTRSPAIRWWDTTKIPGTLAETTCQAPSVEEVKQAYLVKTSTSPGPDGITVQNLKGLWSKRLEEHLTEVCKGAIRLGHFPQAWKLAKVVTLAKPNRDPKTTSGWRPITLLSVLGKGLERLVQRRMAVAAVLGGAISRDTAGGVPLRSAQDLVACFVHDADKARRRGKHGFLATFDVKSAFPSVSRATLGAALTAQGWRPETVALAQSFITERKFKFGWNDTVFKTSDGLPQGSPWSPILLTLVLATVVRAPGGGSTFTYVDDIAQYSTDRDPEVAARRATKMAWRLDRDLRKAGMSLDPGKTELLYTPPGGPGSTGKAVPKAVRNLHLPAGRTVASPQVTWLGVALKATAKGGVSFPANVAVREAKAQTLTALTKRVNAVYRGLRPDAARSWFKSGVVPTLSYGLWPLFQGHQSQRAAAELIRLEMATRAPLKALTPAWRTSPAALRYWVMGFSPQEVWGRELARASIRLQSLPASHPISYRLGRPTGMPSRLGNLYLSNLLDPAPEKLDPVGPGAAATAGMFGLKTRPQKASRPKGDPGPRLKQADPEPWWEANKPKSFAHVKWDPKCSWERGFHGMSRAERTTRDPALVEGRGQLHTLMAEGSGHGNFESYHVRFNHPPSPDWFCLCGEIKEVGHTDSCELRRVPAPWRKKPLLEQNNTEEAKWWRRGKNAMIRVRIEKTLKNMGVNQLMHVSKNGIEAKGQAAREEGSEDSDAEEELPIVEVGRLE
ncbi:hypothetical protein RB600_001542 [Gaeumannomyces tritici]